MTTIVLVHGAFADAASFGAVTRDLLADGLRVVVPAVPNRSLSGDAAYVASVVRQIDGPVLLVGHSYGGAVITVAGVEENVVGLVYLAGYALEEGESLGELQGRFPDPALASALVYRSYPVPGGDDGTDVYVDVEKFPAIFAAGVDPQLATVLAVSQRPLAGAAFAEKASAAAWRTKPSWGLVSSADRTINPEVERFGYARAGMTTVEVDSSHLVMLARPQEVVELIREAARATAVGPAGGAVLRVDTAEVAASGRAQAGVAVLSAAVERCRITHLCDEASVWARWGCVRLSPTTGVVRYDGSGLRMTRRVGDVLAEPSDRLLFAVPAAGGTLWQDGLIRGLHGDDLVLVDPSTPYDYRGGEGTCSAVRVDLSALAVSVVQARAAAPRLRARPLRAQAGPGA